MGDVVAAAAAGGDDGREADGEEVLVVAWCSADKSSCFEMGARSGDTLRCEEQLRELLRDDESYAEKTEGIV